MTLGHSNWDLASFFETDEAFQKSRDQLLADAKQALVNLQNLPALTVKTAEYWANWTLTLETLHAKSEIVEMYVYCRHADDVRDEKYAQALARFSEITAVAQKNEAQFQIVLASADDESFEALLSLDQMKGLAHPLQRRREAGSKKMSPELEALAADLAPTGLKAWGRLYSTIAGSLTFDLARNGKTEKLPMALRNSMLSNPDADIRADTLQNANLEFARLEEVFAAALNAISGQRLALYKRRGISHFLDQALFDAGITSETLDAMMAAIKDAYELPREFLRRKAQLLGKKQLGFQDLAAPMPSNGTKTPPITWDLAGERIVKAFHTSYHALGEFAETAIKEKWIESEIREGKSPGGFCGPMGKQSRIFMTYNGTLNDIQTLAHELGHAFHNEIMKDIRQFNREYPMTLAETASTFAETLFTDALLSDPNSSDLERLKVLDTRLKNQVAFILDTPMRFIFERSFYEERKNGPVSVSRIKELMLNAQRETFGDALNSEELDPYFWASKLHFYITEVSFYNFPYSFGYLFSMGIYAQRERLGDKFEAAYEELLRATGAGKAEKIALDIMGIDLTSKAFWAEAIESTRADLTMFKAILAQNEQTEP